VNETSELQTSGLSNLPIVNLIKNLFLKIVNKFVGNNAYETESQRVINCNGSLSQITDGMCLYYIFCDMYFYFIITVK